MASLFQANAYDRFILAATIYGEARGEPTQGKIAVGWVVRNRAQCVLTHGSPRLFGTGTLASAAQYPEQFSCWNKSSPEAATMARLTLGNAVVDVAFAACLQAADEIIAGTVDDPTDGSLWYHTTAMRWPEAWGVQVAATCVIGAQAFYNHLG